jgi:glutaredoxin 3
MDSSIPAKLARFIAPGKVFVFSTTYCPYCVKAKDLLESLNIKFGHVEVDAQPDLDNDDDFLSTLEKHSKIGTYPKVYIGSTCIGGFDKLSAAQKSGKLFPMLKKEGVSFKGEENYQI